MPKTSELLPCPFPNCGGEAFIETDDEECDIARACCKRCGACGAFVDLADHRTVKAAEAEAARLWNTRTPPLQGEGIERDDVIEALDACMCAFNWFENWRAQQGHAVPYEELVTLDDVAKRVAFAQETALRSLSSKQGVGRRVET